MITKRLCGCFVPGCPNTKTKTKEKVFFHVRPVLQRRWCHQLKIEYIPRQTHVYCCEDHLNLEEDLANYHTWKLKKWNPRIKSTAMLRNITENTLGQNQKSKKKIEVKDEAEIKVKTEKEEIKVIDENQEIKVLALLWQPSATCTPVTIVDPEKLKIEDTSEDVKPALDLKKLSSSSSCGLEVNSTQQTLVSEVTKLCRSCMASLADSYLPRSDKLLEMFTDCTNIQEKAPCTQNLKESTINVTQRTENSGILTKLRDSQNTEIPLFAPLDKSVLSFDFEYEVNGSPENSELADANLLEEKSVIGKDGDNEKYIIEILDAEFLKPEDERKKEKDMVTKSEPDKSDKIAASDSESECLSDYYSLDGDKLQFRKTCRKCQKVLTCQRDYRRHMRQVHRKRVKVRKPKVDLENAGDAGVPVKCKDCSEEFACLKDRAEHFKAVHLEQEAANKRHLCPHCLKKKYTTRGELKRHILEVHTEKSQLCSTCGAGFNSRRRLLQHSLVHDQRKKYICDYCQAPCRRKGDLRNHIFKTHTDYRPVLCSTCGRGFKNIGQLRIHTRTHTGEQPYACDLCPFRSKQRSNMVQHRQRHGPPTHPCPHCHLQLYGASELRSHIRKRHPREHTDENQFVCTQCKQSFATSVQRTMHLIRTHGFGRGPEFDGSSKQKSDGNSKQKSDGSSKQKSDGSSKQKSDGSSKQKSDGQSKHTHAREDASDGQSKHTHAREDSLFNGQSKQKCARKATEE